MSKFEIKNIVPISQAYYSLDNDMQIVDSNSGGEVCYNVPKEFVNKALDVNALILDSQIKQNRKNENNEVYILSDNYSLLLGKSLKWFIDEKDESIKYKLIIVKRTNGKFVMAKADFRALESNDEGYRWFNKLYDKGVEGFVIYYSVDDTLKQVIIDIRLNGIKEMEDINSVIKQEIFELDEMRFKRNRIVFGAPGTGKSYKLNIEKDQLVQTEEQYERVTFHPDYSYANFVGTYKPVMTKSDETINQNDREIIEVLNDKSLSAQEKYDKLYDKFKDDNSLTRLSILIGLYDGGDFVAKKTDGSDAAKSSVEKNHGKSIKQYVNLKGNDNDNGNISYQYVPGPFMRLFVKALLNPDKPYLLLIEEINRANVAAVFGDLFQLLDRDDKEESEYPVEASEDIKKFLHKYGLEKNKIKIPNNMFIWATMNSADQGVFPMDTAFKRRWDFDYIGIDNNESQIEEVKFNISVTNKNESTKNMPIYWNDLRKSINKYLSENKINEDKQLGPYFISKKILNAGSDEEFCNTFKNKVIMYLFEDAAKQKRMDMFSGSSSKGFDANRYSEICKCFDKFGVECFNNTIETDYILRISSKEQEKGNE